ncbi:hypothetical protein [Tenacibaculum sp. 190524A05c]|uniref:hypothetical protein n=1 Tax=Tenacibaculum platacis TaxID=3137852 RepID=UPI0032B107FE
MFKYLIIFILSLTLCSCFKCDLYLTNQKGLRSSKLYKKYLKNRIDPNHVNIKTHGVYKSIKYKYEEESKKISKITDTINLKNDYYFKFYTNGTYYSFSKKRNAPLNKNSFDPEKGKIGFVIHKRNKNYFLDYSTINCGSFSKWEFETKKDTLIVKQGNNKGWRIFYYYVLQDVSNEFLNYPTKI